MKLFQNLTCGFREEEFAKISSLPYSASGPHSAGPRFFTDQNFPNNFEKSHQRKIPEKLFQNLTNSFREDFKRMAEKISLGCNGNQSF